MSRPLGVILGPTAGGKSALAHAVARVVGAEILAVDSMTVYRGMDLGTAKPTPAEQAEVRYNGLDLADVDQTFTVAQWLIEAERVIDETRRRGCPLILCGGTPLYYQALFHGLFDGPPADAALRDELAECPTIELHRRLAAVDAVAAGRIHVNDRRRLTRALEVFHATGRPISRQQTQWAGEARFASLRFGLQWERTELNRRINLRTKQMIDAGWLEEVRGLLARHGDLSPTAAEAAGYRLLCEVARDRMRMDDAVEQIKVRTRQLAKRQMTWFRRFENVHWLLGNAPLDENVERVVRTWRIE